VIREFCALKMPVLLVPSGYAPEGAGAEEEDKLVEVTVEELLPRSFGPEFLEMPRPGAEPKD